RRPTFLPPARRPPPALPFPYPTLFRSLRDEPAHRSIFSRDLPGKLDAASPDQVDLSRYDLVGLAMQEPQYTNHTIRMQGRRGRRDRKSTRLNSSHVKISYAVFCLKKKS